MLGRAVCNTALMDATDDLTDPFDCPRCGTTATARFWGPCDACRDELRATVSGVAHEVEAQAFEPKMNVTPNAVATKD